MTALGWLAGETVVHSIKGFDFWIAMALLGCAGVNLIVIGFGLRIALTYLIRITVSPIHRHNGKRHV